MASFTVPHPFLDIHVTGDKRWRFLTRLDVERTDTYVELMWGRWRVVSCRKDGGALRPKRYKVPIGLFRIAVTMIGILT